MIKEFIQYLEQSKELYGEYPDLGLSREEFSSLIRGENDTSTTKQQETVEPKEIINQSRNSNIGKTTSIDQFHLSIKDCMNCRLGKTRTKFVFGKGNQNANIMLIGEAPGQDEDLQGIPFVGKAGQLLDKILSAAKLGLNDVYIANILKCRPPNNRDPQEDEIKECISYLKKQIEFIKPKMILALGRVAGKTLLGQEISLSKMRNTIHKFENIDMMVTYHPSALLRNPQWKRPTWDDIQAFMAHYQKNYQEK
jgi:uracil-DNA glycosylase